MTPWLRTLRATALVGALGAGAVVAPYGADAAHGAGWPAAPFAVVAAPSPEPSASGAATVPDGSGTHDGRGGHERPRHPDARDRPDARPATESAPATSASPSPSPSPSGTTADPEPSRGGSLPGEGRQRPPHAEEHEPEHDGRDGYAGRHRDDDIDDDVPETPATALPPQPTEPAALPPATPTRTPPQTGTPARAAAEPLLRVLPLGSGLVLIGLGLALGLAGLRMRRA